LILGASCLLGVGINSMRERVEASHGAFRIRSHAGSGTAVSAVWGASHEEFQWSGAGLLEIDDQFVKESRPLDLDLTQ
jgi:hypothetical protein